MALACFITVSVPSTAWAQGAPARLPTREELQRPQPQAPVAKGNVRIKDDIEQSPCPLDNPAYAAIRLRLTKATFGGLGPVPEAVVADAYRPYLDTDQPVSVVCRIRDAAATRLRALGYIAAVEVPVQRITDGQVRFEVLYGRISAVRVVGEVGRSARLFEGYLSKLADGQLFNRHKAERLLLLARDVPGYDIQLTLKPAKSGAGDLIAEVRISHTPLIVDFSASSLAGPATGPYGGQLRATFNGLLGQGDQTSLSVYSTAQFHEQQIYQAGEDLRLGGNGLRLGGHLTYAVTRPDLGPGIPPVRATTLLGNVELGYPIVRRLAGNVRAAIGLDILDQNVRFTGIPLSRDRLRVGYARLDVDAIDLRGSGPGGSIGWRAQGSLELRQGLSVFGASPNCRTNIAACSATDFVPASIPIGDPKATVVRASALFDWHPARRLIVDLSTRGQIASGPLLAYEQMALGNFTVGRGYYPGTLTGDDGVGVQLDVRSSPFRLTQNGKAEFQPYAFFDNGWIWRRLSGLGAQHLASVGGGVRIDMERFGRLDLSAGIPVTTVTGETKRRPALFLMTYSVMLIPLRNR